MGERNNSKGIVIAILSVLLVISILYIGYDKLFKKEMSNINNDSITNSNTTNDSSVNSNTEKSAIVDTTGKVNVKRNGVVSLEKVPSDLVGTYETKCGSYFKINSDGTLYAVEGTGDGGKDIYDKNNTTFQITYIPNNENKDIVLEIYTTTSNGWIFSPFRIGHKDNNGNYSFASLENTPCVNAYEFSYVKK